MSYSKKILIIIFLFFWAGFFNSQLALACAVCDSQLGQAVRSEIIHTKFASFSTSILLLFGIFVCLVLIAARLILYGDRKENIAAHRNKEKLFNRQSVAIAGMLLGGAVAGFLDTILFHQVLQTHAMVSSYLPITSIVNVKVNMFWDGVFEFFTLVTLLAGLMFLWRGTKQGATLSARFFVGWLFFGGGLFNFLEGLLNHEILNLHHVLQQSTERSWFYADMLFLLVAITFMVAGIVLIRKHDRVIPAKS